MESAQSPCMTLQRFASIISAASSSSQPPSTTLPDNLLKRQNAAAKRVAARKAYSAWTDLRCKLPLLQLHGNPFRGVNSANLQQMYILFATREFYFFTSVFFMPTTSAHSLTTNQNDIITCACLVLRIRNRDTSLYVGALIYCNLRESLLVFFCEHESRNKVMSQHNLHA